MSTADTSVKSLHLLVRVRARRLPVPVHTAPKSSAAGATVRLRQPLILALICNSLTGALGSLVATCTRALCSPAMRPLGSTVTVKAWEAPEASWPLPRGLMVTQGGLTPPRALATFKRPLLRTRPFRDG